MLSAQQYNLQFHHYRQRRVQLTINCTVQLTINCQGGHSLEKPGKTWKNLEFGNATWKTWKKGHIFEKTWKIFKFNGKPGKYAYF